MSEKPDTITVPVTAQEKCALRIVAARNAKPMGKMAQKLIRDRLVNLGDLKKEAAK